MDNRHIILITIILAIVMLVATLLCRSVFFFYCPLMLLSELLCIRLLNLYSLNNKKTQPYKFFVSLLLLVPIEYFAALLVLKVDSFPNWFVTTGIDIYILMFIFLCIYYFDKKYIFKKNNREFERNKELKKMLFIPISIIVGTIISFILKLFS